MSSIHKIQNESINLINKIKEGINIEENKRKLILSWKSLEKPDLSSENDVLIFKDHYKSSERTILFLLIHFLIEKDALGDFCEEYKSSNEFINKCVNDQLEFKKILNEINKKEYTSLEQFMKKEPVNTPLKFYFSILQFLNSESTQEKICILLSNVTPMITEMRDECKRYLKFVIFEDLGKLDIRNQVETTLKSLFIEEYSRLRLYVHKDFLEDILKVGDCAFNQLKGVNTPNLDEEENILPVEIRLPKGHNHHSLFVCPVLKVLCGEDNPPVVLKCNHVISLQAASILSNFEANDNFKCPYCPEMCTGKDVLKIEL